MATFQTFTIHSGLYQYKSAITSCVSVSARTSSKRTNINFIKSYKNSDIRKKMMKNAKDWIDRPMNTKDGMPELKNNNDKRIFRKNWRKECRNHSKRQMRLRLRIKIKRKRKRNKNKNKNKKKASCWKKRYRLSRTKLICFEWLTI